MFIVSSPWDADYLFLAGNEKLVISLKKLYYLMCYLLEVHFSRFLLRVGCFFIAAFSGMCSHTRHIRWSKLKNINSFPLINGTSTKQLLPTK